MVSRKSHGAVPGYYGPGCVGARGSSIVLLTYPTVHPCIDGAEFPEYITQKRYLNNTTEAWRVVVNVSA